MSCLSFQLNALVMDETTVDADGNRWVVESLDGWFDGPPVQQSTQDGATKGTFVTGSRIGGRALVLNCDAYHPNKAIGNSAFLAIARLKRNIIDAVSVPKLLSVTDPDFALRSYVRLAGGSLKSQIMGQLAQVHFQVPLLAPDPRRYSQTLTTSALASGTHAVTNNGDLSTPPKFDVTGPLTNFAVTNNAITSTPTLAWTGSIPGGQHLIIDCATETVTLNGVNARADLTTAEWFDLIPGSNSLVLSQAVSVTYRDAYS